MFIPSNPLLNCNAQLACFSIAQLTIAFTGLVAD
jgi:hypothetical protein